MSKDEIQKVTLGTNEALRVTAEGEFIWHPEADAMIEEGDFTSSPAMRHILRALRKALAAPTSAEYAMGYAEGFNDGCKPAPVPEPVAWIHVDAYQPSNRHLEWKENCKGYEGDWVKHPLYTTPPAQPAPVQEPVAYRQTGWAAHRDHYAVPVLFNPYTGDPRDVRDVQSDPHGILIVPPGKVEMLAAKPTHQQGLQVAAPPAAPDLQAELDATNRQVEILSDALAESRREVDAMIALARADERDKWMERAHIMILGEREACAKVCETFDQREMFNDEDMAVANACAAAIRARGNT